MEKTVQVRVRLSSAVQGSAGQVSFTEEEFTALKLLATALGYGSRGLSTMIRRAAELAAGPSEGYRDVHSLLTDAAKRSKMSLGMFLRVCALHAADLTDIERQLSNIRLGMLEGKMKP